MLNVFEELEFIDRLKYGIPFKFDSKGKEQRYRKWAITQLDKRTEEKKVNKKEAKKNFKQVMHGLKVSKKKR